MKAAVFLTLQKRIITIFFISVFLILLLVFPQICRDGAKTGLLLWFNTMIPATFPFILITNILNHFDGIKLFNRFFGKIFSYIFKCSKNGAYAVITGLLCGYPVGAKTVTDSFEAGHISKTEANYLLAFTSMPSPIYLINYVLNASLKKNTLFFPYLCAVYAGCWLTAMTFYIFYFRHKKTTSGIPVSPNLKTSKTLCSDKISHTNSQNLNTCMMDALTIIQKMGIYMILFSILATLIIHIPGSLHIFIILKVLFSGICEQTTGVYMTVSYFEHSELSCLICMFLTCFGGIAVAMQAKSLTISQLDFSFYIKGKLLHGFYSCLILLFYFSWSFAHK